MPITKKCVACDNDYEYIRGSDYTGEKPKTLSRMSVEIETIWHQ